MGWHIGCTASEETPTRGGLLSIFLALLAAT
jgi:hypothetical protein